MKKFDCQTTKDYWENVTDPYDAIRTGWTPEDFLKKKDSLIFQVSIHPCDVVYDIGCGIGYLATHVAPLVKWYYGYDITEKFLAIAKERCKYLHNTTFSNVMGDVSATIVVCELVMLHLSVEQQIELSKQIQDIAPLAKILIQYPNMKYKSGVTPDQIHDLWPGCVIKASKEHYWDMFYGY